MEDKTTSDSLSTPQKKKVDSTKFKHSSQIKIPVIKDKVEIKTSCSCSKTKCLKLYCNCFSNSRKCGESCACVDCYNNDEYEELRLLIMKQIKQTNKNAFKDNSKKSLNNKGCSCSNSKCQKAYCPCYKLGVSCSFFCNCLNCKNKPSKEEKKSSLSDLDFDKLWELKRQKKE